MNCQSCNSPRIINVSGKCSDMFSAVEFNTERGTKTYEGYVPREIGIGGGDYVELSYCLSCGQIQGKFPVSGLEIEDDEEVDL